MQTVKHIFSVVLLITSYNASGMFGFGRQLIQGPSTTQLENHNYFSLGLLHLQGKHQEEYFSYSNSEKYDHPRFKELFDRAKFNEAVQNNPKEKTLLTSPLPPSNGKLLSPSDKKNKVRRSRIVVK